MLIGIHFSGNAEPLSVPVSVSVPGRIDFGHFFSDTETETGTETL